MKFYIYISLFLISGLFSCETPVDLDLPEAKPELVLFCTFNSTNSTQQKETFKVLVLETTPILTTNTSSYLEDVKVELYSNEQYIETLTKKYDYRQRPFFSSQSSPVEGVVYTIRAICQDGRVVSAKSKIPISSWTNNSEITSKPSSNTNGNNNKYIKFELTLDLFDDPTQENFYHISTYNKIETNIELGLEDSLIYVPFEPSPIENSSITIKNNLGEYSGAFISDKYFSKSKETIVFKLKFKLDPSVSYANELVVKVRNVHKDYYLFHTSSNSVKNKQTFSKPFSGNIENGFGIFSGYSSTTEYFPLPF